MPKMMRGPASSAALLTAVVAAGMASVFFAAIVTHLPEQHTEVGSLRSSGPFHTRLWLHIEWTEPAELAQRGNGLPSN